MAETGHARNVGHFGTLIGFVVGYGVAYNPSNAAIELAALQATLTAAQSAIDGVTSTNAPWKINVNERETEYLGIRKLVTRVVNSFAASGAEDNAIEDAKGYKRKIDGARADALPEDDPNTPEDESQGNSVSQRSYVQIAEHFDNLIALLDSDAAYAPNEVDLQVATLQAKATAMKAKNNAVATAAVPLSNARITRDDVLYDETSGLVELAGLVKKYVKSVFGGDSPEFAQLSALQFTIPR